MKIKKKHKGDRIYLLNNINKILQILCGIFKL